jgi:hypothetical protein
MKTYTAILIKTTTIQVEGENIHNAIREAEDKAKDLEMDLTEVTTMEGKPRYSVKVIFE